MKLASLKSKSSRDGELCVVNRQLTHAIKVPHIALTMQFALDNWQATQPQLNAIYQDLNAGSLDNTAWPPRYPGLTSGLMGVRT